MIILAIDTSLAAASVCVYDGSKSEVLARETLAMERGQDHALLPMIDRVVAEGAGSAAKIQRVAVTVGPGSFTGIRIGFHVIRLAHKQVVRVVDEVIAVDLDDVRHIIVRVVVAGDNRDIDGRVFELIGHFASVCP